MLDFGDLYPFGTAGRQVVLTATDAGIVNVTLRFDASPAPNVGFDDISFCAHAGVTPSAPASWGSLKTIYR